MPPRNPAGARGEGPAQIRFHFSWTEQGLEVLHTPARLGRYALPPLLQQSLRTEAAQGESQENPAASEGLIPMGTLANSLQRPPWGTLNVNFEAGPDRQLRVYLSISDLAFQGASDQIAVVLRRNGTLFSEGHFVRWTYHTPPLPPAGYLITLRHHDTLLSNILVELDGSARGA